MDKHTVRRSSQSINVDLGSQFKIRHTIRQSPLFPPRTFFNQYPNHLLMPNATSKNYYIYCLCTMSPKWCRMFAWGSSSWGYGSSGLEKIRGQLIYHDLTLVKSAYIQSQLKIGFKYSKFLTKTFTKKISWHYIFRRWLMHERIYDYGRPHHDSFTVKFRCDINLGDD